MAKLKFSLLSSSIKVELLKTTRQYSEGKVSCCVLIKGDKIFISMQHTRLSNETLHLLNIYGQLVVTGPSGLNLGQTSEKYNKKQKLPERQPLK